MRKFLIAAALLALWPVHAKAAEIVPYAYGLGTQTCGFWLAAQGDMALENSTLSWVQGFLSANTMDHPMRRVNRPELQRWLSKYCLANPLEKIMQASVVLVGELRNKAAAAAQ
jgi:hypothetical protein